MDISLDLPPGLPLQSRILHSHLSECINSIWCLKATNTGNDWEGATLPCLLCCFTSEFWLCCWAVLAGYYRSSLVLTLLVRCVFLCTGQASWGVGRPAICLSLTVKTPNDFNVMSPSLSRLKPASAQLTSSRGTLRESCSMSLVSRHENALSFERRERIRSLAMPGQCSSIRSLVLLSMFWNKKGNYIVIMCPVTNRTDPFFLELA